MDVSTLPCPVCGGTDYEFGNATFGYSLSFKKLNVGNLALGLFKALITSNNSYTHTRARRCVQCENVQLFLRQPTPDKT